MIISFYNCGKRDKQASVHRNSLEIATTADELQFGKDKTEFRSR